MRTDKWTIHLPLELKNLGKRANDTERINNDVKMCYNAEYIKKRREKNITFKW